MALTMPAMDFGMSGAPSLSGSYGGGAYVPTTSKTRDGPKYSLVDWGNAFGGGILGFTAGLGMGQPQQQVAPNAGDIVSQILPYVVIGGIVYVIYKAVK